MRLSNDMAASLAANGPATEDRAAARRQVHRLMCQEAGLRSAQQRLMLEIERDIAKWDAIVTKVRPSIEIWQVPAIRVSFLYLGTAASKCTAFNADQRQWRRANGQQLNVAVMHRSCLVYRERHTSRSTSRRLQHSPRRLGGTGLRPSCRGRSKRSLPRPLWPSLRSQT